MQKSTSIQIDGRFSKVFERTTEKGTFHFINFYFIGGRMCLTAPKFQIDPGTDYSVELELSYMTYKNSAGYDRSVFRPVSVLSVLPL